MPTFKIIISIFIVNLLLMSLAFSEEDLFEKNVNAQKSETIKFAETVSFNEKLKTIGAAEFTFSAALNLDHPPIKEVRFYIYEAELSELGEEVKIASAISGQGEWKKQVPAGKYRIVAKRDLAKTEFVINIEAGQKKALKISLDAAHINLASVLKEGGELLEKSKFTFYEKDLDELGEKVKVGSSNPFGKNWKIVIKAGEYKLHAKNSCASKEVDYVVDIGEKKFDKISLDASSLSFISFLIDTNTPIKASYRIYHTKRDELGDRVLVCRSSFTKKKFFAVLNEGEYEVESSFSNSKVKYSKKFNVTAGEKKMIKLSSSNADF